MLLPTLLPLPTVPLDPRPGLTNTDIRAMNRKAVFLFLMASLLAVFAGANGTDEPEPGTDSAPRDPMAIARDSLVDQYIIGAGIQDPSVINAMRRVQRHKFVLPEYLNEAYRDTALPINEGQTISQPSLVAFMTEVLELQPGDTVLEVGTGSGYQAAVLGIIAGEVYTIEIIESLAVSAAERLNHLGYNKVTVVPGDGYYGLAEEAPFDAIIVTAAAGHVPPPLIAQLKPGGRMVIPIGPVYSVQVLILLEKTVDGSISTRQLLPVRFVPMTGRVQE